MGARDRAYFELTRKGSEELAQRTYRLDAKIRNILFLIQKGYPTIEAILENSIFPREDVVDRLRDLLRGNFVTLQGDRTAAPPTTILMPQETAMAGPVTSIAVGPDSDEEPEPLVRNSTFYFGGL